MKHSAWTWTTFLPPPALDRRRHRRDVPWTCPDRSRPPASRQTEEEQRILADVARVAAMAEQRMGRAFRPTDESLANAARYVQERIAR